MAMESWSNGRECDLKLLACHKTLVAHKSSHWKRVDKILSDQMNLFLLHMAILYTLRTWFQLFALIKVVNLSQKSNSNKWKIETSFPFRAADFTICFFFYSHWTTFSVFFCICFECIEPSRVHFSMTHYTHTHTHTHCALPQPSAPQTR